MPGSILDGIMIEDEEPKRVAETIQTSTLNPIASAFARNAYDLLIFLSLPLLLLSVGMSEVYNLVFFTQALARTRNVGKYGKSPEATAEVDAEIDRLRLEAQQNPESKFKPVEGAKAMLIGVLNRTELQGPTRALLYAAVTSAWASFECAAKDAWIEALNLRPSELAQPAFSNLPTDSSGDGISGKQIGVGLLARHGFDLRDKLGTLLAPKFDFTSISGIRVAYFAAFGHQVAIEKALSNTTLGALEATRHLVVHRAGLVDEEYQRRTGDTTVVGKELQLNGRRITELVNPAIFAGCELLRALDAWLVANPPRQRDEQVSGGPNK